jgi:hypothetical protein
MILGLYKPIVRVFWFEVARGGEEKIVTKGVGVVALWCLMNLWGCAPHAVVQPNPQEHSAIVYAQRMLKEMSKGLEKLRIPLGSTVQEKGTYCLFAADFFPHDVTTVQMMDNFAHFCTHIGGTMVQSVCQASADDAKQVKFLVRIENQSPVNKEFVRWHITVYEPLGPPSAEFLRAIELYR